MPSCWRGTLQTPPATRSCLTMTTALMIPRAPAVCSMASSSWNPCQDFWTTVGHPPALVIHVPLGTSIGLEVPVSSNHSFLRRAEAVRLSRAWDEQIFTCKPALEPGREPQARSGGWFCPWCEAELGSPCPALAQAVGLPLVTHWVLGDPATLHEQLWTPSGPSEHPPAHSASQTGRAGDGDEQLQPWEGKDMSCLVLRAPRSGQSLESKDGEWCRRGWALPWEML